MPITTVTGIKNHADTLVGGADGSIFNFTQDGIWNPGSFARIVGDPGHPGPFVTFDTGGMQASADVFQGAPGVHNTLNLGNASIAFYLEGDTGPTLVNVDKIVGGTGDQVVNLSSLQYNYGSVLMLGRAGDDVLASNAGNDTLNGGSGDDYLWGGSGNDYLNGWTENDRVSGGDGNDTLLGGAGSDLVEGGAGNDAVAGGAGADFLVGGSGNDTLQGGLESGSVTDTSFDEAYGEEGNDLITASTRALLAYGGEGDDTITGGTGNDTLIGGSGSNQLDGRAGADLYDGTGDAGRDTFGVRVDSTGIDTILGFSETQGDQIHARFADIGLTPAPATSTTAGDALIIGGGTGIATVTYSTVANGAGTFDIASIQVASDAVLNVAAGPITATTATATHAQFLFDQSTGDLWLDADGSGAGEAVRIAQLDLATTTATATGLSGVALEAADFLLGNT